MTAIQKRLDNLLMKLLRTMSLLTSLRSGEATTRRLCVRHAVGGLWLLVMAIGLAACGGKQASALEGHASEATSTSVQTEQRNERFDALFLEASRRCALADYDAQYELLQAALAEQPEAPEALYELGRMKLIVSSSTDTVMRAEGEAQIRKAIKAMPERPYYKEFLADYLAGRNRYAEAIELYTQLTANAHTSSKLYTLMGIQEEAGDYAGAIETINRIEAIDGRSERLSIGKFNLYAEMGDNEHAYASIEELCAEFPDELRYRVLLGDLYRQNGYPDMALAVYKDVLTAEPDNSLAQISLLSYYKGTGQDSLYRELLEDVVLSPNQQMEAKVEAMQGFVMDAVMTDKDSAEVLYLFRHALQEPQENRQLATLCISYMSAIGMPEEKIIPVLKQALEIEPDFEGGRMMLIDILLRLNDTEGVAEVCRDGMIYQPDEPLYYYYAGLAQAILGNEALGTEYLEAGTDRINDETDLNLAAGIYATLGDLYYEQKKKNEAYAAYDQSLLYDPDNVSCLNNYAYYLSLDGKRLEQAEAMSRRTINAEPQNATYLDTYAWILYIQKDYKNAGIYIEQAIDGLDETEENAGIFDHAGDIFFRLKQNKKALQFWIKALSLTTDADRKETLKRKVRLKRL